MFAKSPPESAARISERIQQLSAQVKQLSSTVHELSRRLYPAKLEQLGLAAAIHGFCKDMTQAHGLPIDFKHHDIPEVLPLDTALCLYRVVQESLHNVVKHSAARHATVALNGNAETICLRVEDDGKGFDLDSAGAQGGLGFIGMRERLRLVRGVLSIESKPAAGTRIEVRVPR
jgi:signal transduction histidine kinase